MKEYIYGDGSANIYRVTPTTIAYEPVKPKFSSSGFYDGGTPVLKNITNLEYIAVVQQVEQALANKAEHIEQRTKMSGSVTIHTKDSKINFILAAKSSAQKELEMLLKKLLKE